jgi:hypothetical protein
VSDELVLLAKEQMALEGMNDKTKRKWKMLRNGKECGKKIK